MARDDGERRMLFDTRGRRRNVIRVVYATLALLMGTSLFVAVGPFNLAELLGESSTSADEVLDDQVQRLERRAAGEPQNEQLLLTLTRTQIAAGNAQVEPAEPGEVAAIPPEAHADFDAALESWNRYLNQVEGEPNPAAAQLVAGTFFRVAESGATTYAEVERNVEEAAKAQRIAAEASPSVGTLTTLAIYESFNGNFGAADKAVEEAQELAPTKAEAKAIEQQLSQFRKNAKEFVKQAKQAAKQEGQASKERLRSPFPGLGG